VDRQPGPPSPTERPVAPGARQRRQGLYVTCTALQGS